MTTIDKVVVFFKLFYLKSAVNYLDYLKLKASFRKI